MLSNPWEKRTQMWISCMVITIMHSCGFYEKLPLSVSLLCCTICCWCSLLKTFTYLIEYTLTGFDETSLHKPCCGMDGDYEFNLMQMCGAPGVPVCGNPGERISWDGIHLTQNAYRLMTYWLILNILPRLYCIPWICFITLALLFNSFLVCRRVA